MKKRTQIAAWFYIVWSFISALYVLFLPAQFREYPMFALSIGHLLLLICWFCLLKKRTWAWWALVLLNPVIYAGEMILISANGYDRHDMVGNILWQIVFNAIILWILIADSPSGWRDVDSSPFDGRLKNRTYIVAWVSLIYMGLMAMTPIITLVMGKAVLFTMVAASLRSYAFIFILPCFMWVGILRARVWAWWILIGIYGCLALPYYLMFWCAAMVMLDSSGYPMWFSMASILFIFTVVPFWMLLADRPSGWKRSADLQRSEK